VLSSNQIKRLRSLHQKKFRDESGLFLVEGIKQVEELLKSDFKIHEIYATEAWMGGVDHVTVNSSELERISTTKSPNTVLAIAETKKVEFDNSKGFILALDGVRDPGNMGSIFRSASWFGVSGILCSEDCVEIFNPKVVRSSMGAIFKIPSKTVNLVNELTQYTGPKAGLILGGSDDISVLHNENCLVTLGNEAGGVTPGVQACLDHYIEIGGSGMMESLNVAMAGTVVLYEWFRSQDS